MEDKRLFLIDSIRGISLISMICFHSLISWLFMFGERPSFFTTTIIYLWQQSICWPFIFISGFCFNLSHNHLKNGVKLIVLEIPFMVVTYFLAHDAMIRYGILFALGLFSLIFYFLDKILIKMNSTTGLIISLSLFVIGFFFLYLRSLRIADSFKMPFILSEIFTMFGLPYQSYQSLDYFPILPWVFLFSSGYYTYHIFKAKNLLNSNFLRFKIPLISLLGKDTLFFYMIHQPIIVFIELILHAII